MSTNTVLISGASIAGPALAYWLRRYGFTPTVVERAPALREGGHPIDVRGAAVEVVDRMGLLDRISAAHIETRGLSTVDGSGRTRAEAAMADFTGEGSENDIELMRGHLSAVLYQATEGDVEYVFGDSIASMREDGDGVHVTFEHATPRTFDLVVGADGLHSTTRALAFGEESRYCRYIGTYFASFSVPNHLGLNRWVALHNTPGRGAAIYGTPPHTARSEPPHPGDVHDPGPSPKAKALFTFSTRHQLPLGHRDTRAQYRVVERAFENTGWEVPTLLAEMRDAPDFYFDSLSQVHMDRWSRGRVALVGDAGYCPSPMAGQGSSMALVGAYVLASELAAANGEHRAAFEGYESRMRDFVTQNQSIAGSGAGLLVPKSWPGIWFRDQAMRIAPKLPSVDLFGGRMRRAANAVDLENYVPA
ncbi:2-polyprenyl-6-methoxyphenol hydroxylase-like FAD-dependent oxidoreductase [Lipingzhangella halophila]|uniref:2-polyprenyl-6-methoxyphenol hydroxylase-like FAD-dependent oxidoreductase n=1 Tax=Lipingzhangella halophila TaxID=1783352 RepID=A0A7W7RDD3_9ACTN|nr:FAD-dependent monooxygenase [Lipingzhangella halophila]MBB4929735.1 2-polyprenyl-6-methoxyphenol hydroxylase-like FAD-dependent oxidoreductase [Lipingzhangella halophila]